jgi:hypothetical protein
MAESQAIDATAGVEATEVDDDALHCYRHPDRETRLRCRTCDRPICSKCAIQTPVGFRCPEDGKPKNDPFTTFKPQQLVLAVLVAIGGGTIAGIIANQVGFFSIVISFFAGAFIVEAEDRVVGLKRGPRIIGIVMAGILAGALLAFAFDYATFLNYVPPDVDAATAEAIRQQLLQQQIVYALISAGAACVGAYTRLR